MRSVRWLGLVLGLTALVAVGCNDDDENNPQEAERFLAHMNASGEIPDAFPASLTANLVGAVEVPPVTTSATALATLTPGVNSLVYTVTVTNATAITAAHIHDGMAVVANGAVLVPLFTGPTTGDTTGLLASGTITTLPGSIATWDAFFTKLRNGEAYVNIHTTAHSDGEIRSQTAIVGDATFEYDVNDGHVHYEIVVNNAIGVTGAHIHSGDATVASGPVRVTLYTNAGSGLVNGVLASGEFDAGDVTGISFDELLDELRSGDAYVNVHTTAFAAGAIRGQVEPE